MAAESKIDEKLQILEDVEKYQALVNRVRSSRSIVERLTAKADTQAKKLNDALSVARAIGNKELCAVLEQEIVNQTADSTMDIDEAISSIQSLGYDVLSILATGISTKDSRDVAAAYKAVTDNED